MVFQAEAFFAALLSRLACLLNLATLGGEVGRRGLNCGVQLGDLFLERFRSSFDARFIDGDQRLDAGDHRLELLNLLSQLRLLIFGVFELSLSRSHYGFSQQRRGRANRLARSASLHRIGRLLTRCRGDDKVVGDFGRFRLTLPVGATADQRQREGREAEACRRDEDHQCFAEAVHKPLAADVSRRMSLLTGEILLA